MGQDLAVFCSFIDYSALKKKTVSLVNRHNFGHGYFRGERNNVSHKTVSNKLGLQL